MKKLFIIIALFIGLSSTFGQTEAKTALSNAEKFSEKSGVLIKKEFADIGEVKDLEIKVVHYTDLISKNSVSSVRLEKEVVGKYSTDTKIASLDSDEIDGLIKSIKLIQEQIFNSVPTEYTEVSFKSRGGFEAGCFWSKGKWSTYLKIKKYDSKSYVFLDQSDFQILLELLTKSQEQLK